MLSYNSDFLLSIAKSEKSASYDKGDRQKKEIWLYEAVRFYFLFLIKMTKSKVKTIRFWMGVNTGMRTFSEALKKIKEYYSLEEFFWAVDQACNLEECEEYRRMFSDNLAYLCYEL